MKFLISNKLAELITNNDVNIPKTTLSGNGAIQDILNVFFGIAGAVAVLFIALGAFKYVTSRGDSNGIKSAKETILYAIIGLIVTLAGYSIVSLVAGRL